MENERTYIHSFFKILKKAPSPTAAPAFREPVVQSRRKLIDDRLQASIVGKDNEDIFHCVKALQMSDGLLSFVAVMTISRILRISLDPKERLRSVQILGFQETSQTR